MQTQAWRALAVPVSVSCLLLPSCAPDLSGLSSESALGSAGSGGSAGDTATASPSGVSGAGGSDVAGSSATLAGSPPSDVGGSGGTTGTEPDGGRAGQGSSPCVASGVETCNDVDDDCDGTIDEGCPGSLSTTFEKDLELIGDSPGGSTFSDDCPDGEVLSGVTAAAGAFLSQIQGNCRPLSVARSAESPSGFRVVLGAPHALGAHPENTTDAVTQLHCSGEEALVGVRIAQQNYSFASGESMAVTTRLWVTCAKLVLVDEAGKLAVTWQGAKESAPVSGSFADGTAWFAEAAAPAGLVGSRLLGTSGSWIDRIGFGVSRIGVVLR